MFASVTSVILNFVLGYFLITEFGYLAAGYSTLICYFLQATLDYLAMKKVVKKKIYNMRYVGVLSLIVALIAIFSNLLYGNILIRYGIVLALAILCVIFRKKIIGLIKEIKGKPEDLSARLRVVVYLHLFTASDAISG
jgi:O-antigen/teichoic acid export membrane protein